MTKKKKKKKKKNVIEEIDQLIDEVIEPKKKKAKKKKPKPPKPPREKTKKIMKCIYISGDKLEEALEIAKSQSWASTINVSQFFEQLMVDYINRNTEE